MDEIELKDIAGDLLIVNKYTIENLYKLDNCVECIALYIFYYKTAKWQKTNIIKANDTYIRKSLKWSADKVRKTKQALKENGLINIVQRRKNGKVEGWYIQVHYLMSENRTENMKNIIESIENTEPSNNTLNQQVEISTSRNETTNALRINNKCLKNKVYSANDVAPDTLLPEKKDTKTEDFEKLWNIYPSKKGKAKAFSSYCNWLKGKKYMNKTIKLTNAQMWYAIKKYVEECEDSKRFFQNGSTFFNNTIIEYVKFDD